ncbi:hypothetical protein QQ045_005231 [Rhodiola kirilowii]
MYGDGGSVNRNYSPETFHSPHHQLNQQQQRSEGLTRFHSAPTSFFQTLLDDLDITTNSQRFLVPGSDEILSSSTIQQQQPPLQSFIYQDQNQKQNQNQSHVLKHEMEPFDISSTNCNNGFASSRSSSSSSGGGGLLRQSSSPADFFSSLFDDNDAIGVGFASCTGNSQAPHQTTHRPMPSIPEFQQHHSVSGLLGSLFDGWQGNNAAMSGKRRSGDLRNETTFSVSNELWHQHQNGYASNASNGLIHQMSLPNTSSERAAMDKYLQFQESSTPCSGTRAKRGFATHPRSIAERVRRTKISERMRKLQQLFPDIDKVYPSIHLVSFSTFYVII